MAVAILTLISLPVARFIIQSGNSAGQSRIRVEATNVAVLLQKRDFPPPNQRIRKPLFNSIATISLFKDISSTYYLGGNYPAALSTFDVIAKVETPNAGQWFIRALCFDKLDNRSNLLLTRIESFWSSIKIRTLT